MYFSTIFKIIKKGPDGVLGVNQGARSFTLPAVYCIRFFAYIRLVYVTGGTLYSVFRIHSARLRYWRTLYSIFRIHLARLRYWRHIVFDFSHTFGSFTLPAVHCIRFFAYIRLVYVTGGTSYSVFRIHLARLRYWRHIVFDFSHTFGSFTLPAAHCIRFFAYIWLIYVTGGTLYSVFRIHLARLRYQRHIVFGFSHTFGSFTLPSTHCIRYFAYIRLVYVPEAHRIRFFAYIRLVYVTGGHCIRFFVYIWLVYVTGGHCIRFFAYICP
jgi:hypothetical protein